MSEKKAPNDQAKPDVPNKQPAKKSGQNTKVDLEDKAAPTKPQNSQGHNVNRPASS